MRRTESEEKNSRSRDSSSNRTRRAKFVVCVRNAGYPASLEVGKIYRALPDSAAEARGFLRIIDESGEDYLHPATFFLPIGLSKNVRQALSLAS